MTWTDSITNIVFPVIVVYLSFFLGRVSKKAGQKKSDLDTKNADLNAENADLKKRLELDEKVEPSKMGDYLVLRKTGQAICPACWAKDHNPIPIYNNGWGLYYCNVCNKHDVYDRIQNNAHAAKLKALNDTYTKQINDFI